MFASPLASEVSARFNWAALDDVFAKYQGYLGDDPEAPSRVSKPAKINRDHLTAVFNEARDVLLGGPRDDPDDARKGVTAVRAAKRRWQLLGLGTAVVALATAIIGAAVDHTWAAVGGAVLGPSGVTYCCFKFLRYLRGEEAVTNLLTMTEAAMKLARTEDQYDFALREFIKATVNLKQSG